MLKKKLRKKLKKHYSMLNKNKFHSYFFYKFQKQIKENQGGESNFLVPSPLLAGSVSFSRDGFRKIPLSPIHQTYARKDIKEVKLQPGSFTPATHTNTT